MAMMRTYWLLVVLMIVIHQGVWFGEDASLVAGFLPWGLFYHISVSFFMALSWWKITQRVWPTDLTDESETGFDT